MAKTLALAIDTAADLAGVVLTEAGALLAETTWQARQSHSRDLLPALEWLLGRHGRTKDDLGAVCVCLGPGSYAGLRVGVSTAKTLAYALGIPLAGVGRLAADAFLPATVSADKRIVAVHAAGRAELAWAAYAGRRAEGQKGIELTETLPPQLGFAEALLDVIEKGDIVCGELRTISENVFVAFKDKDITVIEAAPGRAWAVACLGQQRLDRGDVDNPDTLVPLYLRAPAIGPQH
jgi:tRNA threonylcarbamoyl adenosine modification protein YeaZ